MSTNQTSQTKPDVPLTPRTRENAVSETKYIAWFVFKWVISPAILIILWEHFAEILKYEIKPTFLIDLFRIHVTGPFCKLFGEWVAYLSGFVELLKLNELFQTIEKIANSLWALLLSGGEFFKGYFQLIKTYEWSIGSTVVGSSIIAIIISSIIYIFRCPIYRRWVKIMNTIRSCRLWIQSRIPYYGVNKNNAIITTVEHR